MPVLVTVWGASPGVGKSTLCAGLSRWLDDAGLCVDHFREEEILTRPQFAAVAETFQATGLVERATLVAATREFVDAVLVRGDDVVVADALVPFIPSLLAMGDTDEAIDTFMTSLDGVLAPLHPVMIFLDGEAGPALTRAAAREGPGWLDWYIGKLARYKVNPAVHDLASAAEYVRREREVTLTMVRRHNWALVMIEQSTELTPAETLQAARRGLRPCLRAQGFPWCRRTTKGRQILP